MLKVNSLCRCRNFSRVTFISAEFMNALSIGLHFLARSHSSRMHYASCKSPRKSFSERRKAISNIQGIYLHYEWPESFQVYYTCEFYLLSLDFWFEITCQW